MEEAAERRFRELIVWEHENNAKMWRRQSTLISSSDNFLCLELSRVTEMEENVVGGRNFLCFRFLACLFKQEAIKNKLRPLIYFHCFSDLLYIFVYDILSSRSLGRGEIFFCHLNNFSRFIGFSGGGRRGGREE